MTTDFELGRPRYERFESLPLRQVELKTPAPRDEGRASLCPPWPFTDASVPAGDRAVA